MYIFCFRGEWVLPCHKSSQVHTIYLFLKGQKQKPYIHIYIYTIHENCVEELGYFTFESIWYLQKNKRVKSLYRHIHKDRKNNQINLSHIYVYVHEYNLKKLWLSV